MSSSTPPCLKRPKNGPGGGERSNGFDGPASVWERSPPRQIAGWHFRVTAPLVERGVYAASTIMRPRRRRVFASTVIRRS